MCLQLNGLDWNDLNDTVTLPHFQWLLLNKLGSAVSSYGYISLSDLYPIIKIPGKCLFP